jgi:hypothetical protein
MWFVGFVGVLGKWVGGMAMGVKCVGPVLGVLRWMRLDGKLRRCGGRLRGLWWYVYAWRRVGMQYWPAVYFSNEFYADAMSIRTWQAPQ